MKTVLTIFRKELTDTLRDRRTLVVMIVVPILLFPVLIGLSVTLTKSQVKKAESEILRVGLEANGGAAALRDSLLARDDLDVTEGISLAHARHLIQADSLDAAVFIDENFDRAVHERRQGALQLLHKSSDKLNVARRRLQEVITAYEKRLVSQRFRDLELDEGIVKAVDVNTIDVATQKERFGSIVGGFLPYIFVLFCFMGSMYPAIDLGAGEKERGTLETLLASPASRMDILLGKFGVIVLTGLLSAAVSVLGLYVGVRQAVDLPPHILEVVSGLFDPFTLALLLSLLVPLSVFFASLLVSLSVYARSYKEAQSIMSPLTIFIIVPVFIGLIPGMELDATTALIPILNVSLASKEILSGTISYGLLAEVYASLTVLALAGLYGCAKWFGREQTIFRST